MTIIEHLLALLTPHECLACRREGSLLCAVCREELPPFVPHCYRCGRTDGGHRTCASCRSSSALFEVIGATYHEGVAKELVYGMKFGRQKEAARVIAAVLARQLALSGAPYDLVTHAPTAPQRIRQRGYDQAEEIARALSRHIGVPYAPLLVRHGHQRQLGQKRAVRKQQLREAFRTPRPYEVANKRILLIDDVVTTGSTLEAAATVLKAAGAKRISAAAFTVV